MLKTKPKILLVEDDAATRFGYARYLSSSGYEVSEAGDLSSADRLFASQRFDAVIIDINLPDGSGLELIEEIRAEAPEISVIIITGAGDVPLAVDAMRRGADNFLVKPVDMQGLELFLEKNLEVGVIRKLHSSHQRLRARTKKDLWFGVSAGMQEVEELARIAAESDAPVLITGETGTGKGLLAKWIHRHGRRSPYAFVDLNCSGLKGDLLARELFGNARGAFTSADRDRDGLLDVADRGTLFLDEIGEMDPSVQAQFLKVLEEKTYRRLGDTKLRRSDFRLICATNRLIEEAILAGGFRRDLYYRINILTLHIPPLRERRADIADLALHFNAQLSTRLGLPPLNLGPADLARLAAYAWPGNVRELRNLIERSLILGSLPATGEAAGFSDPLPLSLAEVEKRHILAVLDQCGGNRARAAALLGVSRKTLDRKAIEWGVA